MKDPPAPCSTILVNHALLHSFGKNYDLYTKKRFRETTLSKMASQNLL